ncbi:MAG: hypothetical protein K8U03_24385 [Planctomycetia bacterium]|nr:hypothetical protein [Planctomycetia bacterium]
MTDTTEPAKYTRFRTTIILVSMIVMPLFAVVGVKMPKFLNEKMNESATTASVDPKPKARATGTRAEKSRDRSSAAPLDSAVSLAQAEALQVEPSNPSGSVQQAEHATAVTSSAASSPTNSDVRAASAGVSQAVAMESVAASAPPVGFEAGSDLRPLPVTMEEATKPVPRTPSPTGEQFTQIQSRLKALGATHYTLETWGASGNAFRFQCRMAAGHSADYTRQFEATDTDPLRTMQTVLDEVEAWKAGRLP